MAAPGTHMLSKDQVLFFCVGAQKSGTTWLYEYLRAHPQVAPVPLKEFHYFENLYPSRLIPRAAQRFALAVPKAVRKFRADAILAHKLQPYGRKSWWRAIADAFSGRADYDAVLLSGVEASHVAVGDITPTYATLVSDAYADMAGRHGEVRFIFLMRDPLDRLWSQVRMDAGRREARGLGGFDALRSGIATRVLSDRRYLSRADYAGTLETLDATIDAEHRLVLFYEELFTEESIRRICTFLGHDYVPADFDARVHESKPSDIPADWAGQAMGVLARAYDAVARRFPTAMPRQWRGSLEAFAPGAPALAQLNGGHDGR
ncbi:MAG: sulfotransferase [Rubricella sp.]